MRGHVSLGQLKVMSAIESCRTAALGGHVARCEDCAHTTIAYNSCRNRHCPKCQGAAAKQWLAERAADLLQVPYYHVVFTLPAAISNITYHNKSAIYDLLLKTAAETLITIAADPKHPFGGPQAVLAYLSRYTHRVAIANSRLLAFNDKGVTFKCKDYRIEGPGRYKTMTLATDEFIRRFLIHVLPTGFHRIRHYGLFAKSAAANNIVRARQLLTAQKPQAEPTDTHQCNAIDQSASAQTCPRCGGRMIIIVTSNAVRRHAINSQVQSSSLESTHHDNAHPAGQ